MLDRLRLRDFTVFHDADFQLAPGLNVFVGENGTGKSHVLKAAYVVAAVCARGEKDSGSETPTKAYLETALAKKLRGVFRPNKLGRLARRQVGPTRCEVEAMFSTKDVRLAFSFHSMSRSDVVVETCPPRWEGSQPAFIPTRELLTIFPGFVSLYETSELPFEETWRDTCLLLGAPVAKGSRLAAVADVLAPLEEAIGGTVGLKKDGHFCVTTEDRFVLEVHLVAEGMRKLAMVAQLVATGALARAGTLFWDEPEANLNPKIIKRVAATILQLGRSGIQVFVATHSLFLLRELDILRKTPEFEEVSTRFFGLRPGEDGVDVEQGDTVDDIGPIDALDEELQQSDRYLAAESAD